MFLVGSIFNRMAIYFLYLFARESKRSMFRSSTCRTLKTKIFFIAKTVFIKKRSRLMTVTVFNRITHDRFALHKTTTSQKQLF